MAKGTVMSDSIKTVLCRVKNGYYVADIMAHRDIHTLAGRVNELERENVALQEDKERMDWCDKNLSGLTLLGKSMREYVDAARKEQS